MSSSEDPTITIRYPTMHQYSVALALHDNKVYTMVSDVPDDDTYQLQHNLYVYDINSN